MKKPVRYTLVALLFGLLVLIRAFESHLFYDPLIQYFKNDYLYAQAPELDFWKLAVNLFFRYLLNALVSLGIIFLLFKKKKYLEFALLFFIFAYIILSTAFLFLLNNHFEQGYLLPFYIRRFLIHPLFLLILLPIFYYQSKKK